jgi:hypothetical protein
MCGRKWKSNAFHHNYFSIKLAYFPTPIQASSKVVTIFLLHSIEIDLGAILAAYSMVTGRKTIEA